MTTPQKPKAKKGAKSVTKTDLKGIITRIDTAHHGYQEQTVAGLKKNDGLKIKELPEGRTEVTMAGITAMAVGDVLPALDNWCNAARRAITQMNG